jgi:integrase
VCGSKPLDVTVPRGIARYLCISEQVGFAGEKRKLYVHAVRLDEAIGEWKSAWNVVRKLAGVDYRWHDLRHTFITRLAENSNVSEQTITALAGHVSKRMLERYSHIRARAKRDAIATLERNLFGAIGAQNWAQVLDPIRENDFEHTEKPLN